LSLGSFSRLESFKRSFLENPSLLFYHGSFKEAFQRMLLFSNLVEASKKLSRELFSSE
jgi:hypothetical protein